MTLHELKIASAYYDAVLRDYKTFEVRRDDRDFKVGDTLILIEVEDVAHLVDGVPTIVAEPTGRKRISAEVQYILRHEDFPVGICKGYCILGLRNVHEMWEDVYVPVREEVEQ